jgi:hypothetical protein
MIKVGTVVMQIVAKVDPHTLYPVSLIKSCMPRETVFREVLLINSRLNR